MKHRSTSDKRTWIRHNFKEPQRGVAEIQRILDGNHPACALLADLSKAERAGMEEKKKHCPKPSGQPPHDRQSCNGARGIGEKAASAQGFTSLWWGARAHANWAI